MLIFYPDVALITLILQKLGMNGDQNINRGLKEGRSLAFIKNKNSGIP